MFIGKESILIQIPVYMVIGLLAGFSTVTVFNRIPAKWLCDYDEDPDDELWGERISRLPWGLVFSFLFIGTGFLMSNKEIIYQIAGFPALWLLLLIAIADKKYMVIPDQFVIGLAITSIGFIPYQTHILSALLGALTGSGCFLIVVLIGRLIVKRDAMGFGDVKLIGVVGLMTGLKGMIAVLLITVFSSGIVMVTMLALGKVKRSDEQPLGPFIAASAAIFIVFRQSILAYL